MDKDIKDQMELSAYATIESSDESVYYLAATRCGSLTEDYNRHIAAIIKAILGKKRERNELTTIFGWCLRLAYMGAQMKPMKILKYLFKD